ncbi:MAG: hypothetical protein KY469_14735 [Actinobacteria bacterium]|nr:hypothetical protein [Actinomycetota bacterium]
MRRFVTTAVVLLLAATATTGFVTPDDSTTDASASTAESEFVGELGRGDALFWDGPYIDSVGTGTRVADPVLCDSPVATYLSCIATERYPASSQVSAISALFAGIAGPLCGSEHRCFSYAFDVVAGGEELRVAFDQPSLRDKFGMAVYDPNGDLVALRGSPPGEVRVSDPVEGRWVVRLEAFDVRDSAFRMRAALDPEAAAPGKGGHGHGRDRSGRGPAELLPNLQVVPPYEVGFAACQPTEVVDYDAQRCLRFSAGPANVGDGPLDLFIAEDGELAGQMYQRVHRDDGGHDVHEAGDFEWHPQHVHYHHGALQSLELYRVTDPRRGGLELAGVGPKLGFCLAPYHIAEWDSFAQDPPYSVYGEEACTSFDPPVATQMALARGWVDIYQWWVEGNFVEFGDNPDGLYLIRAQSDPDGDVLETDDGDNTAYTYIRVTGEEIEVLERGIGDSPWDRRKTLVDDTRRPTRWTDG